MGPSSKPKVIQPALQGMKLLGSMEPMKESRVLTQRPAMSLAY